jgi:hypothetical protein
MNYELRKAIGYNETGFDGQTDATYRIQPGISLQRVERYLRTWIIHLRSDTKLAIFVPPWNTRRRRR